MTKSVLLILAAASALRADDGMWLFNAFPAKLVREKYGFEVTQPFLDKLRLATVRVGDGSGSFVSPDGLIFTNHHVGADCIQKVSTTKTNFMVNGFVAAKRSDEKPCPDYAAQIVTSIEDVTARANAGAQGATPEANKRRKANVSAIEKECGDCQVVALYAGAQYHLYKYKKYTDLRLVFAPEEAIAAFGGDPDNFTFPRYCLDVAFFRAYENGKPVKSPNYFKWSKTGARDGELVFVSGNPGYTDRLATVAELEFNRDTLMPLRLEYLKWTHDALRKYAVTGDEAKLASRDAILTLENSIKARTGFLQGLQDPAIMARKQDEQTRLRKAIGDDPAKQALYGSAWDEVAAAYAKYPAIYPRVYLLTTDAGWFSDLLKLALHINRYAEEKLKPNGERLHEYTGAALPEMERGIFSTATIYPGFEVAALTAQLAFWERRFGAGDPLVKSILAGRTPAAAAESYVGTSKLADLAERKRLAASADAVRSSEDGMMRLARLIDGPSRQALKQFEDTVEAVTLSSSAKIAQARFAVYGASAYPDATFTLRLTYGAIKGYKNEQGANVPWTTVTSGLFERASGVEPFRLPASWPRAKAKLNPQTPFNFVSTLDTHGGNSGSPTVNAKGEVVGILFDGNIEGLPNRYVFTDERARSVHVATQIVVEALGKVYGAKRLRTELGFSGQ